MPNDKIKEDLRKLYDEKSQSWGRSYESLAGRYFMRRKIETALSLGDFKRGDHILEVGSANGSFTFELAKLGFRVTGLDISAECIKYARGKAERLGVDGISFITGDAEELGVFPENTFDGVVSFSCLRYAPNPQKAINEIFRVVRKNGNVVVDFPNKLNLWFNMLKPLLTGSRHIHDHDYSTWQVRSFFRKAGFQEIEIKRILYIPKSTADYLLEVAKVLNFIGELPPLNHFAAIIMCKGKKSD